MKYIFSLFLGFALLLSACGEDFFSSVVEVEIPEHEAKPALRLVAESGASTLGMLVSNSKGILEPSSAYQLYPDAVVQLFKNGSLLTVFTPLDFTEGSGGDTHKAELLEALPSQAGDVYALEAKLPGFDLVRAEQVMPPTPNITDISFTVDGTINEFGERVSELVVDIQDPEPGVINYYGLSLLLEVRFINPETGDTTYFESGSLGLESNDPLLSPGDYNSYNLIFSDEGLPANGRYQLRCYTYNYYDENASLSFRMATLTRDGFLHLRSKSQYFDADGNPFAEPVTVHSNVAGGYGIFMLANAVEVRL